MKAFVGKRVSTVLERSALFLDLNTGRNLVAVEDGTSVLDEVVEDGTLVLDKVVEVGLLVVDVVVVVVVVVSFVDSVSEPSDNEVEALTSSESSTMLFF